MRWANVGTVNGVELDLVLVSLDDDRPEGTIWGRVGGKTGLLFMAVGKDENKKSANVRFTFVKSGTNNPVTVENFFWTFFDIGVAHFSNPDVQVTQIVTPLTSADSVQYQFYSMVDTETGEMMAGKPTSAGHDFERMEVLPNEDGLLSFKGKSMSNTSYIGDALELSDSQKTMAVTLFYKNTASFDVQFDTEFSSELDHNVAVYFRFAGTSSLSNDFCDHPVTTDTLLM